MKNLPKSARICHIKSVQCHIGFYQGCCVTKNIFQFGNRSNHLKDIERILILKLLKCPGYSGRFPLMKKHSLLINVKVLIILEKPTWLSKYVWLMQQNSIHRVPLSLLCLLDLTNDFFWLKWQFITFQGETSSTVARFDRKNLNEENVLE